MDNVCCVAVKPYLWTIWVKCVFIFCKLLLGCPDQNEPVATSSLTKLVLIQETDSTVS